MANHDWFEFILDLSRFHSLRTVDRAPPPWANNLTYSATSHALINICTIHGDESQDSRAAVEPSAEQAKDIQILSWGNRQRTIWLRRVGRCNLYCHFRMHKLLLIQSTRRRIERCEQRPTTWILTIYRQRERRTECKSIALALYVACSSLAAAAVAATSSSTLSCSYIHKYIYSVQHFIQPVRAL